MKALTDFVLTVIIDAALAACIYAWKINGFDGAGNIAMFYIWFLIITGIVMGFFGDKSGFKDVVNWPGKSFYRASRNIAVIAFLVWFGYIITAALFIFAWISFHIAKNREPKPAEA